MAQFSQALALFVNNRLGQIGQVVTNALAYHATELITAVKSVMLACTIKLFTAVIYGFP